MLSSNKQFDKKIVKKKISPHLEAYFILGELKPVASSDAQILFISKFPNSFLEKFTPQPILEFDG